jgi:signal transduction protein with GAF and PtsI domain
MAQREQDPLLAEIETLLEGSSEAPFELVLDRVMARLGCVMGTIHLTDPASGNLHLRAQRGLPPPVLEKVAEIPFGKGMAGLAAARREAVQVCNLQQDSEVSRPGAKATGAEGSIACPLFARSAGLSGASGRREERVFGVLGVAKQEAYDFTEAEVALLSSVGRCLAEWVAQG